MITPSTSTGKLPKTNNAQTTRNKLTFNFLDESQHAAHNQLRKHVYEDGISMRLVPGKGLKKLSPPKQDEPLLNYQLGATLGNGANGKVVSCKKQEKTFALKTGEHKGDPKKFEGYLKEALFHLKMTHLLPHHTIPLHKVFITPNHFHFLMAEGSKNLEALARNGNIPPKDVPAIILQLHKILLDMRTVSINHNDVQLKNFLGETNSSQAACDWHIKVIDFGAATNQRETEADVMDNALMLFKALTNELNWLSMTTKWPFDQSEKKALTPLKAISRTAKLGDNDWLPQLKALSTATQSEKTNYTLRE